MYSDNDAGDRSDRIVAKEVTFEKHIEPCVRIIILKLLHFFDLANYLSYLTVFSFLKFSLRGQRSSLIKLAQLDPLSLFFSNF